jgi:hypothetical protein
VDEHPGRVSAKPARREQPFAPVRSHLLRVARGTARSIASQDCLSVLLTVLLAHELGAAADEPERAHRLLWTAACAGVLWLLWPALGLQQKCGLGRAPRPAPPLHRRPRTPSRTARAGQGSRAAPRVEPAAVCVVGELGRGRPAARAARAQGARRTRPAPAPALGTAMCARPAATSQKVHGGRPLSGSWSRLRPGGVAWAACRLQ